MVASGIYAAIDLETTGLSADTDEIIEVGIVRCTPDEELARWSSLVRPREMPNLRVSRLTGITPSMLLAAPSFDDVAGQVRELLADATPIGHNVRFDLEFLEGYGIRADKPAVDTFPLSQIVDPAAPSHRLGDLCARYGIDLADAHRALDDAEAARLLLLALQRRFAELPEAVREDLQIIAANTGFTWDAARTLTELYEEHPATGAGEQPQEGPEPGGGDAPARVQMPPGSLSDLTTRALERAASGGMLDRREEQLAMAASAAEVIEESEDLIVEAGTGTGKSLAYLVPAAIHAMSRGERVVVSTHTRNLQSQLLEKDLPRLRAVLQALIGERADELRMAVLKGRENYLCRRELLRARDRASDPEEAQIVARATVWAAETETGDLAELRLIYTAEPHWNRLSASDVNCLYDDCRFVAEGTCFLLNARRRAAEAHLIVVNHALLVADAGLEKPAIPAAPVLVVDEAQELEGVATRWLSESAGEETTAGLFNAVAGRRTRGGSGSRASGLVERLPGDAGAEAAALRDAIAEAEPSADEFFALCGQFVAEHGRRDDDQVLLDRDKRAQKRWSEVEVAAEAACRSLDALADGLAAAADAVDPDRGNLDEDERAEQAALARDLAGEEQSAREIAALIRQILSANADEVISWLAKQQRTGEASLHVAPLSVSSWLRTHIWDRKDASLLTGATLSYEDSHERLRGEVGLEEPREQMLGSPFDYGRQARAYAAVDAPPVNDPAYVDWLGDALPMLIKAAGGRTMVLFTAYNMMRRAARAARSSLELADIALAVQGSDGGPAQVAAALIDDPKTAVFGVQSLWAGVDVPGDALSQLIIARLPFPRPNDPVEQGRSTQFDNPFIEQSLPQAVVTFRQGFGRLIRSMTDRGACVILDERMVSKRYGQTFARALPVEEVEQLTAAEIAAEVHRFLGAARTA